MGKLLMVTIGNQLRQGDVLIARTRSNVCLVTMLEYYMERTGIRWNDQSFPNSKYKKMARYSGNLVK